MTTTTETQTGFLPVEGGQLYYEVTGEGHPFVLIHAGVADHTMWDAQVPAFCKQYKVIRYDTRAFGKSRTEDVPFSNRHDLYDLLKHLNVEKAFVLGLSRGGQIAIDFTLEHPEMVDAVIACAAGLSGHEAEPTEAEIALFKEMEEAEEKGDFARVADMDVRVWVDGPTAPAGRADASVRDRVLEMCLHNYTTHTVWGQPVVLDPPAAGRLNEIKVPALLLWGDLDTSGVLSAMEVMSAGIPDVRKVMIPGTAHMLNMEKPDEFNRAVLDFLGSLSVG